MKRMMLLGSLLLLLPAAAEAKVSKGDCKAHAAAVDELAERFGLRPGIKGRALMDAVESWVDSQEEAAIRQAIADVQRTTAGIRECDEAGFSSLILKVKGTSQKLEAAVLPWLQDTAAADPCQGLINQAIRKRSEDLDGAIADLERSTGECQDDQWLPEAYRNLVELYYERGDVARGDYRTALERTQQALGYAGAYDDAHRDAFRATLAKATIEAGARLMELEDWQAAQQHWRAYAATFGTIGFDVLFDVESIAQGAWMLRELEDARYQLVRACIATADAACVREELLPAIGEYADDMRPIKNLTDRIFSVAREDDRNDFYLLGFDLLTAWNELDPGAFQVNRFLEQVFLGLQQPDRLAQLRLTEQCWIPMQVAEMLRQEQRSYLAEVEVAASCGDSAGEARQILTRFHVQAAEDRLARLAAWPIAERRKVLDEVERDLLPKLGSSAEADSIRSKIAAERGRIRNEIALADRQRSDTYSGCTQLLATIQWNRAREESYDRELSDFRTACCGTLTAHTASWVDWMRSQPESVRLADEEIENKRNVMRRFCKL